MSLEIALSGIYAVNSQLGSISNNIANSGTYGFKSSRANFSATYAGTQATGVEVASNTQSIGRSGGTVTTGRALDAAIQGRGFFVTRDNAGSVAYTRVGIFNTDKDGVLVDSFGRHVQGYAAVSGSTGGARGALGDITVPTGQIAAKASDTLQYVGNLSSGWTTPATAFAPADPTTFNGSSVSTVYDSLGEKHTLTQYFVKNGTNDVTVHFGLDGSLLADTADLAFDSNGALTSSALASGAAALNLGTPTGASALSVKLDYTGTTQFAGDTTTTVNSGNGYASGALTGVSLQENGDILATYSNGQKQAVGTIALANFPNENGLIPVSATSWVDSPASGTALLSVPGSGLAGTLSAGSLEQSNVDMTAELVNLMTAQRNYQANTKVISTEGQVIQALMQAV
ncbi:flagellar hook protein FlgE [Pseudogulbenkiania subflava]|uniref:Flagellar hook protein FlgE n=1 Tax=Pseudogulbenkiania subflava DSM 22618 TaxID=1123014 RepID=A0A1Y6BJ64_9NEIS|nr:flagellar hook-basal body complex protein [Pseudogulbenkiania subflava]SMF06824.1 flagellar hook protein FlgE [Pseudogulbenkiania subflava DSM 22618]